MEDFASQQMLEQKEKDPLDGIGKKGGARAFSTETEDGARHSYEWKSNWNKSLGSARVCEKAAGSGGTPATP